MSSILFAHFLYDVEVFPDDAASNADIEDSLTDLCEIHLSKK